MHCTVTCRGACTRCCASMRRSVEPYSIDEMFLDLAGMSDPVAVSVAVREAVLQRSENSHLRRHRPDQDHRQARQCRCEKDRGGSGVVDLSDVAVRAAHFSGLPVGKVWGIGPAAAAKLTARGIGTIAEFIALADDDIRKLLSVVGLRTAWELRGIVCAPFTEVSPTRNRSPSRARSASRSRTGATARSHRAYATRASEKLRRHGLVAAAMQVFVMTNRFAKTDPQYVNQTHLRHRAIGRYVRDDCQRDTSRAPSLARGFRYAKAGVVMLDLAPSSTQPMDLLPSRDPVRSAALMRALDAVNSRYGRGALRPGWSRPSRDGACASRISRRATPRVSTRFCESGRDQRLRFRILVGARILCEQRSSN